MEKRIRYGRKSRGVVRFLSSSAGQRTRVIRRHPQHAQRKSINGCLNRSAFEVIYKLGPTPYLGGTRVVPPSVNIYQTGCCSTGPSTDGRYGHRHSQVPQIPSRLFPQERVPHAATTSSINFVFCLLLLVDLAFIYSIYTHDHYGRAPDALRYTYPVKRSLLERAEMPPPAPTTTPTGQNAGPVRPHPHAPFHPMSDQATYRDLLLFEERLKMNAEMLRKRRRRYNGESDSSLLLTMTESIQPFYGSSSAC